MRNLFTFLLVVLVIIPVSGQVFTVKSPDMLKGVPLKGKPILESTTPTSILTTTPGNTIPTGTVTQDAVTAIKIGEASNAFTYVTAQSNQISTLPGLNAVSFIYRQNTSTCGGDPTNDNGRYRYSISTDGGNNWNVGSAGTSSAGNAPLGCYGQGEINPSYLQHSRYPNAVLSLPSGGSSIDDAVLVYSGPTLGPNNDTWDGIVAGLVSDLTDPVPSVDQEIYQFQNGDQHFSWSLIERVQGEYWYVSLSQSGYTGPENLTPILSGDILLHKGLLDTATNKITWTVQTINVNSTGDDYGTPRIAFSPDGQVGYVAFWYDGNGDGLFGPGYSTSNDGGITWSAPEEVDLGGFSELRQLLSERLFLVDAANPDSFARGGGDPTMLSSGYGLAVDSAYNAHIIGLVLNGSRYDSSSKGDSLITASEGFIHPVFGMLMFDFTRDEFGDWNAMFLSDINTFDGTYGDPSEENIFRHHIHASRSVEGDLIFATWSDTDTLNNQTLDNNSPDLIGISYNVATKKLTTLRNWTADDQVWPGRAILPKVAPIALSDNNCIYTIPTTILDVPSDASFLNPVSFWYFSNVTYDKCNDYTEDPQFFYNCKQNPFSNSVNVTDANCGQADGTAAVVADGGLGSYTYQWDAEANNATTASVSNLSAGIYSVIVTDVAGCTDEILVTVDNVNAQVANIDSVADISCTGFQDGYATVSVADPASIASYTWSNGQSGPTADSLPEGLNSVVIIDTSGCESLTTVEISEPATLVLFTSNTNLLCFGESTASATAFAGGGSGELTFSWDNGASSSTITELAAGTYNVMVTDENGCQQSTSAIVTQPDSLALEIQILVENTNLQAPFNGEIIVFASGGTGTKQYRWTGPDGFSSNNIRIFGLNGGLYNISVTDENGCVTVDSVFLNQAVAIEDQLAAGINKMEVYPNPSSGTFIVNLELMSRDDVDIEVININGQTLAKRHSDKVLLYKEDFSIDFLPAGIYMIKVKTSKGEASKRLMVR